MMPSPVQGSLSSAWCPGSVQSMLASVCHACTWSLILVLVIRRSAGAHTSVRVVARQCTPAMPNLTVGQVTAHATRFCANAMLCSCHSASSSSLGCAAGWPSFFKPVDNAIEERADRSIPFLPRVEVGGSALHQVFEGVLKLSVADHHMSCRCDARLAKGTWDMSLLMDQSPLVSDTA